MHASSSYTVMVVTGGGGGGGGGGTQVNFIAAYPGGALDASQEEEGWLTCKFGGRVRGRRRGGEGTWENGTGGEGGGAGPGRME